MKRNSGFFKIFLYTAIFAFLLIGVTACLFSAQITSYYRTQNANHVTRSYSRLVNALKSTDDIPAAATRFAERNQSLEFTIRSKDGAILFTTSSNPDARGGAEENAQSDLAPGGDLSGRAPGILPPLTVYSCDAYDVLASYADVSYDYSGLIKRVLAVLFAILALSLFAAFIYARQILKLKYEVEREQQLAEAQRYFFSAASHELKTPIAATGALLEGMLAGVGDYKDHAKYLRECLKLTETQSGLVSDMLEIISITDGQITPVPENASLRRLIDSLLPEYQPIAKSGGLRMATDIPDDLIVLADRKMLKRALSNVILNAVQNTQCGGEVKIYTDNLTLCVLNTGAAIPENELPKLFDPFYRVDKARNQKDGRSGLGLAIVKKSLAAMKIKFSLKNTPDGVLFRMDLPQAEDCI
jgi:two-component system sensor histidine kinase VanS